MGLTTMPLRILTRMASKKTTGYMELRGRLCQASTSSNTRSVTVLTYSALTPMQCCSSGKALMSRVDMPRAYVAMILSSDPEN